MQLDKSRHFFSFHLARGIITSPVPTFELLEDNISVYFFLRYMGLSSISWSGCVMSPLKSQLLSYLCTLDTDVLKRSVFVAKPPSTELRQFLYIETERCNPLCVSWNLSNNGYGEFPVTKMLVFGVSV